MRSIQIQSLKTVVKDEYVPAIAYLYSHTLLLIIREKIQNNAILAWRCYKIDRKSGICLDSGYEIYVVDDNNNRETIIEIHGYKNKKGKLILEVKVNPKYENVLRPYVTI